MVDVSAEYEVERLNKAKEEVKKAKIVVDMRSLYERLKKSVNRIPAANDTDFPHSDLQTLSFEQLHQKLLEVRQLSLSETSQQTYRRQSTGNVLFLMKNRDKKYYKKMGVELGKTYSKRYCYSMIECYQFCVKYPRMKFTVFHNTKTE